MRINNTFTKLFITIWIIILTLLLIVNCGGSAFKILVEESLVEEGLVEESAGDTTPPEVVSVISIAIDKMRIEYSEEVDSVTASDTVNYTITGLVITDAEVTSNAKVVQLTTDYQLYTTYNIEVSVNIQDLNENQMEAAYTGVFQGAVEEPRIVNVTTTSVTGVLVEFSEAVDATADIIASYSISPSMTISDVVFPYGGDSTFAELTLGEEMVDTSYTVEIVGDVQDAGGYSIHPLYKTLSFQGDARPKVAMINSGSKSSIRIKFTEDVDGASAETPGNYTVTNITNPAETTTVQTATRDASDNSIVILTHTDDITANSQEQDNSYRVVINNLQDLNGNTVAAGTSGYFLGNGPPSVASAAASGSTRVIVTFSEPIDPLDDAATITAGIYTIAGLSISSAAWPLEGAGDRTVVELTTSQQLQQIYTLVLSAGVLHAEDDKAAIAAGYNAVSFQGDGIPTVSSAVSLDPTHVKVVFSEPVDLTTAQNKANYTITSAGYPSLSIT
ncbi:MAG: hypothetical protein KAJ15_05500, partial [Spirochaetes bacterium]|nr:hypothetical protein [Spirochaetota bacterium]